MSASRSPSGKSFTVHIPRNSLKIAGIAFGVGVLLFVVVWLSGRRNNDFLQADPAAQTPQQVADVAPLPEPLPAAAGSSDMPDAKPVPVPEEAPKLVETAPAPPPAAEPAPAPAPAPGAPVGGDRPMPIANQSPAPEYPSGALRRGETGSVVVRVEVDAGGQPTDVSLVQRSGSRELDRAAMDAVRQWRFTPAHSNGQPVAGSIEVPFDFKTGQ